MEFRGRDGHELQVRVCIGSDDPITFSRPKHFCAIASLDPQRPVLRQVDSFAISD